MITNIYFIINEDTVKIGRSGNVKTRIKNLQTSNYNNLKLKYIIENVDSAMEKQIHAICKRYQIKGEWFKSECLMFLLSHPWYKEKMKEIT